MEQFTDLQIKTAEAQLHSMLMREHNDCVVRALSVAASVPYPEVHRTLKSLGRRGRSGTKLDPMFKASETFGLRVLGIYGSTKRARFVEERMGYDRQSGMTLGTFRRINNKGRFMVVVTGHALVVHDGVKSDSTSDNKEVFAVFTSEV